MFTFFDFNIELCVFDSKLPVEFLKYTVSKESSLRFQGISVSALCLLCMYRPGFSLVPQGFYVLLFMNLLIWGYFVITSNGKSRQHIINAVCCVAGSLKKGKFITCNKFFVQIVLHHWSACRLHFSTSKMPYIVILHHRLKTDYNFQDLGYNFLQEIECSTNFEWIFVHQTRPWKIPKILLSG